MLETKQHYLQMSITQLLTQENLCCCCCVCEKFRFDSFVNLQSKMILL